jgi:multidrug efflux pump subunit AcrA (membrane-fusion protein)
VFTKRNIVIAVIILALVGGFFYYRSQSGEAPLQTETVKRGDVSETVSISGELVPAEYADLSFQGTGTVDQISVKEGDVVRKDNLSLLSIRRCCSRN